MSASLLTERRTPVRVMSDAAALDLVAEILGCATASPIDLDHVAEAVRATGRTLGSQSDEDALEAAS